MKIAIMYYYDLENPTIYKVNQMTYIKSQSSRYMLKEVKSLEELQEIYTILANSSLVSRYHEIVPTKGKELAFTYNGIKYALIRMRKELPNIEKNIDRKIELQDRKYGLDRTNWYFLWSKKNDYLEYQSEYLGRKFSIANEAIDYYIGMAETAIAYLKNNVEAYNKSENKLILSHRRISDQEINNPLNIVIDTKERDISEYLKYLFVNNRMDKAYINNILIKLKTKEELYRLYARMLYPSYFFDTYERIINNQEDEINILKIIRRIDEYECYLRDIFNHLNKSTRIKKIDWL